MKRYRYAGLSEHKGCVSVRYANSATRDRVLSRNGHTRIYFVDLGEQLPKEDCVDHLLNLDFKVREYQEAIVREAASLGFVEF